MPWAYLSPRAARLQASITRAGFASFAARPRHLAVEAREAGLDDRAAPNQADEHVAIVDHRDEVLRCGEREELLHLGADVNRQDLAAGARNVGELDVLGVLEGHLAVVLPEPQEVALGQRAAVMALVVEQRHG